MLADPLGICSGVRRPGLAICYNTLCALINAGINPNEPYVIDDFTGRLRIRTNALTHLLARWDKKREDLCRRRILHTLLRYGADARVPALYEVTPLVDGAAISIKQGVLSAASGQSLMAFQRSMQLDAPPLCNFSTDLIMIGHARFLPSDPDGLFVKWALQLSRVDNEYVIDFLCPMKIMDMVDPIAGGLLAPGEKASGQLLRLIRSFDSASKMNILHLFVSRGSSYSVDWILEQLRMLRHVYGLSDLTPTQDRRTVRVLAADSPTTF